MRIQLRQRGAAMRSSLVSFFLAPRKQQDMYLLIAFLLQ